VGVLEEVTQAVPLLLVVAALAGIGLERLCQYQQALNLLLLLALVVLQPQVLEQLALMEMILL